MILNIQKKLRELGYNSVPQTFYNLVDVWKSWYDGNVSNFHKYTVYNGIEYLDCQRYTVGMAKKVSEDWANLLLNEKVNITLEGEEEQKFVDDVLEQNNFRVKGNEMQERKAALGTTAYVPRVEGATVDKESGKILKPGVIKLDYCTAPAIYPLSWENGIIRECAFVSAQKINGKDYTYIQIHKLEDGKYVIENRIFEYSKEVPLTSVPGYENIPKSIRTDSEKPQFIIDRLNIANPDEDCPMGIAVFANAIDQLKGVDVAYDGYVNEFVLGKKRIVVKPEAVKSLEGKPFFDVNETVYYVLPEDSSNKSIMEQVDMTLRTAEFNAGMQDMLNVLSSKCGFGENHYKYDRGNISTATQVVNENSTLFRTIKKHEIILRNVLTELCRTILRMGNQYMGMSLNENAEISIDFDDSIIEDTRTDNQDMRADVAAGLIRPELYIAKKYGVTEKEAIKMMPGMEDMTTEGQDDVE